MKPWPEALKRCKNHGKANIPLQMIRFGIILLSVRLVKSMEYETMTEGRFIRRRNRFIAEVMVKGTAEAVHVRNTGRLRELFVTDARVLLEPASNPERKTRYSLVCVEKNGQWVNVDSTAPNQIVEEMVRAGRLFSDITYVKREKTFGKSRFDLYVEHGGQKHYIEVKGVTLEVDGAARFPDAPTERGLNTSMN